MAKNKQTLTESMEEAHEATHGDDHKDEAVEQQLTPKEQAEMLRNYVQSMQKVEGYDNEAVRNIIESVYKRFLLILNYSPLSKVEGIKEVKTEMKKVLDDELLRYADEGEVK